MGDQFQLERDQLLHQFKEAQKQVHLKNGLIDQLHGDHESQLRDLKTLIQGLEAQNEQLEAALSHEQ